MCDIPCETCVHSFKRGDDLGCGHRNMNTVVAKKQPDGEYERLPIYKFTTCTSYKKKLTPECESCAHCIRQMSALYCSYCNGLPIPVATKQRDGNYVYVSDCNFEVPCKSYKPIKPAEKKEEQFPITNNKQIAEQFLDELIAHIILAGGKRNTPEELKKLTLGEIMRICFNNNIILSAEGRYER